MKKAKTLESKLRAAIRLIWSRSAERRAILTKALYVDPKTKNKFFNCPICKTEFHQAMADVDHIDAVGALDLNALTEYVARMFNNPQRVICKICHKKKTAEDRRKMKKGAKND